MHRFRLLTDSVIILSMIKTFADKATAAVFARRPVGRLTTDGLPVARRKLDQLHQSTRLDDLRVPPGNQLEKLTQDRAGQYSIRINEQWRICFEWREGHAWAVEITDYH